MTFSVLPHPTTGASIASICFPASTHLRGPQGAQVLSYLRAGLQASLAGSILPTSLEEQGQLAAASAADSAVTVLGQRDLQHHRTQQGQRQHLPQEGSGDVSTASLKDMSRIMSLPCCGHQAGAHVLTAGTLGQHSQLAPFPQLCLQQREEAGPGEAAGLELWGSAVAGSKNRLWLPHVYRHVQQPCPGRQGLKPHLFIATTQPGLHLLITSCCSIPGPLCNSLQQHHQTGPSARCARTGTNRIWLAACCLLPCACSTLPVAQPPAVPW